MKKKLLNKKMIFIMVLFIILVALIIGIIFFIRQNDNNHNLNMINNNEYVNTQQGNERNSNIDQVEIITEYINIRKEKDVESDIVGKVYEGEVYSIISFDNSTFKWIEIQTNNNIHGYISGRDEYVKLLKAGINSQISSDKENISSSSNSASSNNNDDNSFNYNDSSASNSDYYCDYGWRLEGKKCYKEYAATIKYECVGGKVSGSKCLINKTVSANVTYSCPTGYELTGSTCWRWEVAARFSENPSWSATERTSAYNTFRNNCSKLNATKYEGNVCYYKATTISNVSYDCNGKVGELAGNACVHIDVEDAYGFPSCPDGGGLINKNTCSVSKDANKR